MAFYSFWHNPTGRLLGLSGKPLFSCLFLFLVIKYAILEKKLRIWAFSRDNIAIRHPKIVEFNPQVALLIKVACCDASAYLQ